MAQGFPAAPFDADHRAIGPSGLSRGDQMDWLPSEGASVERLHAIRQRVVDARSLMTDSEVLRDLNASRFAIEQRIAELTKPRGLGGFGLDDDHAQVIAERKKFDKAVAELKRVKTLDEARTARWTLAGQLAASVKRFLENLPGDSELVPVDDPPISEILKKGETVTDGIERLQRRVRDWRADLHRVKSAPYPSAVARELAAGQIDALAASGEPYVGGCIEHLEKIVFPMQMLSALVRNTDQPGAVAMTEIPNALGLVAWLFRDELKQKIFASISADADDANALTAEERRAREATINADVVAVERIEVALIFRAQTDGVSIDFRSDTSPLALLGLKLAPRQPSEPTFERTSHSPIRRR